MSFSLTVGSWHYKSLNPIDDNFFSTPTAALHADQTKTPPPY